MPGILTTHDACPFEFDDISQAFLNLLVQGQYGIDVDLWTHASGSDLPSHVRCHETRWVMFTYIEDKDHSQLGEIDSSSQDGVGGIYLKPERSEVIARAKPGARADVVGVLGHYHIFRMLIDDDLGPRPQFMYCTSVLFVPQCVEPPAALP